MPEQDGVTNQVTDVGVSPAVDLHNELNQSTVDVVPNQPSQNEPWYLREGVAGIGEKPDWFNDKTFKSVEEQAKSQVELRKMLGSVPNEYKMDLGDDYEDVSIPEDDPLLIQFNTYAKENKISSKAYNNMIKVWVDYQKDAALKLQEQGAVDQKKELDAIGPDAKDKLIALHDWYSQNFGEDGLEAFKNSVQTKADYDRYTEIRNKMGYAKTPAASTTSNEKKPFELQEMMSDKRYIMDTNYTKMVDEAYKKYYGK